MHRSRGARLLPSLLCLVLVGALAPASPASAFCGFYVGGAGADLYNRATMVVLMREGARTVLSMQNNYEGPPQNFAMVVPVPHVLSERDVRTLPREIFSRVDRLAAPRLVEYWEQDPCYVEPPYERSMSMPDSMEEYAEEDEGGGEDLGVTIEAQFVVGEYEIVILSARDSAGLDTWLRRERYSIPEGAEPVLRPYVQAGTKFFVARVDVSKVRMENGRAMLSPLRFHFDSPQFSLPIRLGLLNSTGTQDLIVHILSRSGRYEVANYDNVTIPTNLVVTEGVRNEFGPFYASLFDRVVAQHPRAVVTEYAWSATGCDPCPVEALSPEELATLGGDVISGEDYYSFTLTRLHHRYTREQLGEDLVFRQAQGIVGGRGVPQGQEGALSPEVQVGGPGSGSSFQGRYVMLHPWEGEIACETPSRGRWGGPPAGQANPGVTPATNLAFVTDRSRPLESLLASGDGSGLSVHTSEGGTLPDPATPGTGLRPTGGCASCAVGAERPAPRGLLGLLVAGLLGVGVSRMRRRRR